MISITMHDCLKRHIRRRLDYSTKSCHNTKFDQTSINWQCMASRPVLLTLSAALSCAFNMHVAQANEWHNEQPVGAHNKKTLCKIRNHAIYQICKTPQTCVDNFLWLIGPTDALRLKSGSRDWRSVRSTL